VPVSDERGRFYGTALYSSSSQITLRMVAAERIEEAGLLGLLRERIRQSIAYRDRLGIPQAGNAYRLVFSEADRLPGLIADRYGDVITLQLLTQAMNRSDLRAVVVETLSELLKPAGIVERSEARIRELESLPPSEGGLVFGAKAATTIQMNGLEFHYDSTAGQKTGAFLDQRENYAAAGQYARGDALDVFCYQGGFALHLAKACRSVTGVDASRAALEAAEGNEKLNRGRLLPPEIEWIEANAFDLLRDYSDARRQYDSIVLDPPAFAKSKSALATALRGYKELNLRALKMLRPGGLLVSCSCSHHVSPEEFVAAVIEAARDAHRRLRIVELRGASRDHPVVAGIPETAYLKCVIGMVD
jgi:23S rRNA (cytosine1962-C5)-methyltransferase